MLGVQQVASEDFLI